MSANDRAGGASGARKARIGRGWLAAGGALGAVLASSCCILPLAFATLGISGAWIGNLTALEPVRPYFAVVALVFIGLGFRRVYFRPNLACEEGAYCARPESAVITKTVLGFALALTLAALTVAWWAPLLY